MKFDIVKQVDPLLLELLELRCEIEGMIIHYNETIDETRQNPVALKALDMVVSINKSEDKR